ncbi:MAG: flagellin [Pseudomonadota bacterium]|nr:flagellin [Pseudomonadota bacterium]
MSRVSNAGQNYYINRLLNDVRHSLNRAQLQVSSGKKSQNFSYLGPTKSSLSISMRQDSKRIESYVFNLNLVGSRLDVMVDRMENATDIARNMYNTVLQIPRTEPPNLDILHSGAGQALEMMIETINTNVGDRYLFAGTDISNRPLNDMDALKASVDGIMDQYMAGMITGVDVVSDVDSLSDVQLGYNTTLAGADPVTVQIEKNYDIDYTHMANGEGLKDIIKGLQMLASVEYDPALHDEYLDVIDGAGAFLQEGALKLDSDLAGLGIKQQMMEDMHDRHEKAQIDIAQYIGRAEDVDIAEAVVRMQLLQTQLEVSYHTLGSLKNMTLMDYM